MSSSRLKYFIFCNKVFLLFMFYYVLLHVPLLFFMIFVFHGKTACDKSVCHENVCSKRFAAKMSNKDTLGENIQSGYHRLVLQLGKWCQELNGWCFFLNYCILYKWRKNWNLNCNTTCSLNTWAVFAFTPTSYIFQLNALQETLHLQGDTIVLCNHCLYCYYQYFKEYI